MSEQLQFGIINLENGLLSYTDIEDDLCMTPSTDMKYLFHFEEDFQSGSKANSMMIQCKLSFISEMKYYYLHMLD